MTKPTKVLLGLAAALAVVTATGCCLPLHGGHYGHWDRQDRGSERPAPPARPDHDPRWR